MSYCFNPTCTQPRNGSNLNFCQTCGNPLLLRGRYRALAPLGSGGMGRTFRGIDLERFGAPCAIKQLLPHLDRPENLDKAIALFEREARHLGTLGQHPQIPALLAFFAEGERLYLIQELIEGRSLLQILEGEGVWDADGAIELLRGLLPVLQYLHDRGTIHRDIKPENILRRSPAPGKLPSPRDFVLVDFGAAKFLPPAGKTASPPTIIGTLGYAPPEQLAGQALPASDLYALGATCLHMLTGRPPGERWEEVLSAWGGRPDATPGDRALQWVLQRMVAVDPQQRFATARDVLAALDANLLQVNSHAAIAVPLPKAVQAVTVEMASCQALQGHLEAGRWREADRETLHWLLPQGHASKAKIQQLDCALLLAVDRLWRTYSRDRFGLSVQRELWENLGGQLFYDSDNYWKFARTYLKFADRVGWRQRRHWFAPRVWRKYDELLFTLEAPRGHLPSLGFGSGFTLFEGLLQRLHTCQSHPGGIAMPPSPQPQA